MRKWFSFRPGKPQESNHKFSNRLSPEARQEDLQYYLAQLEQNSIPEPQNRSRKKVWLLLGSCGCLAVAIVLLLLFGGAKVIGLNSSSNSLKEEYLSLEQKQTDPLQNLLSLTSTYLTNLRKQNSLWSGSMSMKLKNPYEGDYVLDYSYDIKGEMTKDYSITSMGFSLNNAPVGTSNYFCDAKTHNTYVSFPDYSKKHLKANQYNSSFSSALEAWNVAQYDNLSKVYTKAIHSMAKADSLSHKEDVEYKIGNLITTCNCYEVNLTRKDFSSVESEIYSAIYKEQTDLPSFISDVFVYLDILLTSTKAEDTPIITMKVYYKDDQILGRTFSFLSEEFPLEVHIGNLPIDNEFAFLLYFATNTPENTSSPVFSLQINAIKYNRSYNGSFSLQTPDVSTNGTFSGLLYGNSNTLFPINGKLSGNIVYTNTIEGYPESFSLFVNSTKDQMNLNLQLMDKMSSLVQVPDITSEIDMDSTDEDAIDNFEVGEDIVSAFKENMDNENSGDNDSGEFMHFSWIGSLNLSAKITNTLTITPPEIHPENVANNLEEYSDLVSTEPIEKLFNNFYKAKDSTTQFTHDEAVTAIKKGYLCEDFANMTALLDYYINSTSSFDPTTYGLNEATTIDPFGDYEEYPYYDEISSSRVPPIPENAVQIAMPDTYDVTIDTAQSSIHDIVSSYTNRTLNPFETGTGTNLVIHGNIYQGNSTYTESNQISCTQFGDAPKGAKASEVFIWVYYDTLTKKIYNAYIEIYGTTLTSEALSNMGAELAHVLDPSHTTEEYKHSYFGDDTSYLLSRVKSDKGQTNISLYINTEYASNNEMPYYYALELTHKN